jgi:hypothetical protein
MSNLKRFALLALAVGLCGCDGHVRSFKPSPAAGRTGAETTAERQTLVDAVTAVAARRGYTPAEPKFESDAYTIVVWFSKPIDRGSVQMKLVRDTKTDACRVLLIDWPSFVRSAESIATEAAIKERLSAN